ncbi:MAG: CopG family transcriptional regulator [Egibacteraceae bacterium]
MNKTSVYLTDEERRHLAWVAKVEKRSQSEVIREAIAAYQPKPTFDRDFKTFNSGASDPEWAARMADMDDNELLEGFGEDSFG